MTIRLARDNCIGSASPSGGGGATINNEDLTITSNGTYTASEGYTGIGTATVNVPEANMILAKNMIYNDISNGDVVNLDATYDATFRSYAWKSGNDIYYTRDADPFFQDDVYDDWGLTHAVDLTSSDAGDTITTYGGLTLTRDTADNVVGAYVGNIFNSDDARATLTGIVQQDMYSAYPDLVNADGGIWASDCILTSYTLDQTLSDTLTVYKNKTFEGVFKVKAPNWNNDNHFVGGFGDDLFYFRGGSSRLYGVVNIEGTEQYANITGVPTNTWIYLKVAYTGGDFYFGYSTDGVLYTKVYSYTLPYWFYSNGTSATFKLGFGCKYGSAGNETWNGEIDFKESYFKVDGKVVWNGTIPLANQYGYIKTVLPSGE